MMDAPEYIRKIRAKVRSGFITHPMYAPFQEALAKIASEYGIRYELVILRNNESCTVKSVRRLVEEGVPDERIIAVAALMFPDLT